MAKNKKFISSVPNEMAYQYFGPLLKK